MAMHPAPNWAIGGSSPLSPAICSRKNVFCGSFFVVFTDLGIFWREIPRGVWLGSVFFLIAKEYKIKNTK